MPQCRYNSKRCTALKVRMQCPLVLLVKVAGDKTSALGGEESIVMGGGLLGACSRGRR